MINAPRLPRYRPCLFAAGLALALVHSIAIAGAYGTVTSAASATIAPPQVRILEERADGLRLEFTLSDVTIEELSLPQGEFRMVSFDGGEQTGGPGEPMLPTYARMLAIPDRAAVEVRVTGQEIEEPTEDSGVRVIPMQTDDGANFSYEAAAYSRDDWGDTPLVRAGPPAILRGVRVVPLTFAPVQYNPARSALRLVRRVEVDVSFQGEDPRNVRVGRPVPLAPSFARMYDAVMIRDHAKSAAPVTPGTWLLICPDDAAVISRLSPLVEWRKRKGYPVVLATTTQTGSTKEQIKAYIQNAYDTWTNPPEFVVLAGDCLGSYVIPTWNETVSSYMGEGDQPYVLLDGNDILADAHVGRLSFQQLDELDTIVAKITNYEVEPSTEDPSWFTRACLTGDPIASGISTVQTMQWIKSRLRELAYTQIDTVFSGPWVSGMSTALNRGDTIFAYRGIYGMSGWSNGNTLASRTETKTDATGTHTRTQHVWVSNVETVVEIEHADAKALKGFVPEPGRWLAISVRANLPTLFRFELDGVTRYPGFATNANVDDAFFLRSGLAPLRGRYKNDDPDLIFDPWSYEGQPAWKWNGWSSVETTKPSTAATVFVTAMDYAAWGRLRVLAKGDCRAWEPADIRMEGRSQGYLVLPFDANDDLMADALPEYAGDPGRDDELGFVDSDFPEDAKPGDGLTALEEYRGFLTAGADCRDPRRDKHVRTSAKRRDLFVNATHAALVDALDQFGDSADLDTHRICARHYLDDSKRVVNATLQAAGLRRFHGYVISQSEPQHGLLLENRNFDEDCRTGENCELGLLGKASTWGPPKLVSWVRVDVDRNLNRGMRPGRAKLLNTVTHELGHALGIKHHGDGNKLAPIVVLDRSSCPAGTRAGSVDGKQACEAAGVAMRHAENSGDQFCPMKYVFWSWYVPESAKLEPAGTVEFVAPRADGSEDRVQRAAFRLTGKLMRYEQALDGYGLVYFCNSQKGTGINELPGDRNHAGDSTRICAQQLRVSDVR